MEYLFSYGTLQKEKTQFALFGHALNGAVDFLTGYQISAVEITDEAFLAKGDGKLQKIAAYTGNKSDCVEGITLEVTMEELLLADTYEPSDYKRIKVSTKSGKEAWVYATR